jgi:hypothetical protein
MPKPAITTFSSLAVKASPTNKNNGLYAPQLTAAQIAAIPAETLVNGAIVYDADANLLRTFVNGALQEVSTGPGSIGDVVGPGVAVDDHIATFDGITGKLIKDSGVIIGRVPPLLQNPLNLLTAPSLLVNEIGNLGHVNFVDGLGIIFVDGLTPVEFLLNDIGGGDFQVCSLFTGGLPSSSTTPSALVELQSTDGALLLSRMTTVQSSALFATAGMILFDTDLNAFRGHDGTDWLKVALYNVNDTLTVATPIAPTDAATKDYVDNAGADLTDLNSKTQNISLIETTPTLTKMTQDLKMGEEIITGSATGTITGNSSIQTLSSNFGWSFTPSVDITVTKYKIQTNFWISANPTTDIAIFDSVTQALVGSIQTLDKLTIESDYYVISLAIPLVLTAGVSYIISGLFRNGDRYTSNFNTYPPEITPEQTRYSSGPADVTAIYPIQSTPGMNGAMVSFDYIGGGWKNLECGEIKVGGSTLANKKIVLKEVANNDHQFFGFGVNTDIARYQTPSVTSDHVFYAGASTTTSNELARITGAGDLVIPGFFYGKHPRGVIYAASGAPNTIANNTWVKMAAITASISGLFFDLTSSRLTYIGPRQIKALVTLNCTLVPSNLPLINFVISIHKNGVLVDYTRIYVTSTGSRYYPIATSTFITLAPNDYVEAFILSDSADPVATIYSLTATAI